jgi:FKBP12-rapamycin complex-associated protein
MNCRAYAKALHYKEEDFHRGVTPKLLESLIAINNKLQQPDAAVGVLMFAKERQQGDFVSYLGDGVEGCYSLSYVEDSGGMV